MDTDKIDERIKFHRNQIRALKAIRRALKRRHRRGLDK